MKASYKIGVKQVCRQYLSVFITARFSEAKRRNARVLCFAGREALEVFEIYDALGVPLKNIVCLEKNRRAYNELVRRNQGFDIRLQTLDEFIDSPGQGRFDIVSLDFTGQLGTYENSINRLVKRGFLEDDAIVFTNFCGAREADATQGYYWAARFHRDSPIDGGDIISAMRRYPDSPEKAARALEKKLESSPVATNPDYFRKGIAEHRGDAIHEVVRSALMGGSAGIVDILCREWDQDGWLSGQIEQYWNLVSELPERDPAFAMMLKKVRKAMSKKDDTLPPTLVCYLREEMNAQVSACVRKFARQSRRLRLNIPMLTDILTLAIDQCLSKPCCLLATQSYKYVSDGGTPMYADLYHLRRIREFDYLEELLPENSDSLEELLDPVRRLSLDQFLTLIETLCRTGKRVGELQGAEPPTPERVFIGRESELNPRKKAVVLDRAAMKVQALQLLSESPELTIEDIALKIGAKPMQVAAWKAHMTMGTYSPASIDRLRDLADREYDAGRFPESLELTSRLLRQQPDSARLLNNRAVILGSMGREREALSLLDRALRRHPHDPLLLVNRAGQLQDLGRMVDAEVAYQAAAEACPQDSKVQVAWGHVLRELTRHDEANLRYDAALALEPNCFEAKRGKAITLSERGRYDAALLHLDLLIEQHPEESLAYYDRSVVLLQLGRADESLGDLRTVLSLKPHSFSALYNLGTTLLQCEKYEEAHATLLRAVQAEPSNKSALHNLAFAATSLGRDEEAAELWSQILKLDPESLSALHCRARTLLKAGLLQESLLDCDQLVERVPDSTEYWSTRGRVLFVLNRTTEAYDALERAIALDGANTEAQVFKGLVLSAQSKFPEAISLLNDLKERFPGDTRVALERAEVLCRLDFTTEAMAGFEEILQRESANASALGGKARVLCRLERFTEALHYLDESLRIEPLHFDTQYNKASVLTKLGRFAEAVSAYDICVQMHPHDHQAFCNRGTSKLMLGDVAGAVEDLTRALNLNHQDQVALDNLDLIRRMGQQLVKRRRNGPKRIKGRPAR